MSSPRPQDQQRALEAVVSRAAVDRAFRGELLTDPRGAIQRAFGVHIPADFRIKFVERGPDVDALIVLPEYKGDAAAEEDTLSDAELDAVAGGTDCVGGTLPDGTKLPGSPGPTIPTMPTDPSW